jgi:hypothetical protein
VVAVCGPIVDQLRQDFWDNGARKCDTRKAFRFFDLLIRDQEAGGSNPLAPTTFKFPSIIDLRGLFYLDFFRAFWTRCGPTQGKLP